MDLGGAPRQLIFLLARTDPQARGRRGISFLDLAEAVAFLASDRAAFITGEILNVAGGAYMRN